MGKLFFTTQITHKDRMSNHITQKESREDKYTYPRKSKHILRYFFRTLQFPQMNHHSSNVITTL